MSSQTARTGATYSCHVWQGAMFRAVSGVNHGDALGPGDALCAGDIYRLAADAEPVELIVADAALPDDTRSGAALQPGHDHRIAPGTDIAPPGTALRLTARATFLAADGHSVDLMLLELDDGAVVAFALGPLEPGQDYTLAGVGAPGEMRLADIVPIAFAAGTRITMADGSQRPVESLQVGDVVLTRDGGPQPLRAVLHRTERALGPNAPVVIAADTLGNPGDLILSQHQRLLVYQRGEDRLTETAEMLVRAGDLVNRDQVFVRRGGFVTYVALVLEQHEMLYAECVAVESLEVNAATLPRLPDEQASEVGDLDHAPHFGTQAGREIAAAARARLLRRDP